MSQESGSASPIHSRFPTPPPQPESLGEDQLLRTQPYAKEAEHAMRVRREILQSVFRNSLWLSPISLVAALSIVVFAHDLGTNWLIWLSSIALAATICFAHSRYWLRNKLQDKPTVSVRTWELYGMGASFLNGCAWASLTIVLNAADPMVQAFGAFIFCCILVFVTTSFSISCLIYPVFVLPIFIVQSVSLLFFSSILTTTLFPLWLIFCVLLFVSHAITARSFQRRISERITQQTLATEQRVLINTLSLGVLVTQRDIILDCNDQFLKMYGYVRDQLIGQSTRIFMISEEEFADSLRRNTEFFKGAAVETLAQRKRADGSIIHVEIRLGLIDPADPESAVVGVYEDVSERLTIERELRDSQARFRMAIDALQSGVWDYNTIDQNFFTSRRFMQVLGYEENTKLETELQRMFFYHDWIVAEDGLRMERLRSEFVSGGTAFDEQYRLQRPDGQVIWVRESVLAQLGEAGQPVRYTGSITDVTANNEIQEQLRDSERLHRSLIDTVDSLIWHTDANDVLTFVNERGATSLYGYTPEEMIGRKITEFAAPESLSHEMNAQFSVLADGMRLQNTEVVHFHKSGRRIYLSVNAVPLFVGEGQFSGVVGINTNITPIKKRQRAFQEAVRLQRLIFDSAGEGIVIERNGRVFRANQAFVELVGGTLGDVIARPLSTWFEDPVEWQRIEVQLMALGNVIKVEQVLRRLDGRTLWVLATGRQAALDSMDQSPGMIWVFADISVQKQQEEQSWHRANHDELTGLANRRMLQDRLEQALGHARRESSLVGLLMLDLDGFKEINDTHGHRIGDEMLRQVADRLSTDIRQLDTVARMGGDEFVVVLHNVESLRDIEIMALRLIERIREPMEIEGIPVKISTSIGISMFPESDESLVGLLHAADMAMYAAKASGKNAYRIAEPARRMLGH